MNIAFVTLLIFIILLPGFLFISAYHSGKFSRRYVKTSIFNDASRAIIPSIIFHSLAYIIIRNCSWFKSYISLRSLGILLLGSKNDILISEVFQQDIGNFVFEIFSYIIISVVFGFVTGKLVVGIIRKYHLDLTYSFFRFDNEWYYALTGEILGWKENGGVERYKNFEENDPAVFVDVLSNFGGELYIYSGFVLDFYLDEDGLDNLHLDSCYRRKIDDSIDEDESFIPMEGQIFLIPSETILNVNISYYQYKKEVEGTPEQVYIDNKTDIDSSN
ncbi:conserved membrane hypothetical protein [Tenacibaculum litopenaei]|uniref:hypothetical protein n=1 Tax=Tenacibaculum litopenaei TaxID=396016 RepID=UPI003892D386